MSTSFLSRPEGQIAYTDQGRGHLVICVPGVGDLRSEYRLLAPALLEAGHRVVTLDLRGHGESDATFTELSRAALGSDVVALLSHLDAGPAHLVGCSIGASAIGWAAAEAPDLVASATLIGPFLRDQPDQGLGDALQRGMLRLLLSGPWGPRAWTSYLATLFPGDKPDDFTQVRDEIRRNLTEPGRMKAMRTLALSTCADVQQRLDAVTAPSLVVMGTADPDWKDPVAEAHWIADRLGGEVVLAEGAGHYPHVERPEATANAIRAFLADTSIGA